MIVMGKFMLVIKFLGVFDKIFEMLELLFVDICDYFFFFNGSNVIKCICDIILLMDEKI